MASPVTRPWSSALRGESDGANVPGAIAAATTSPTSGAVLASRAVRGSAVRAVPQVSWPDAWPARRPAVHPPGRSPARPAPPTVGRPTSGDRHDRGTDDEARPRRGTDVAPPPPPGGAGTRAGGRPARRWRRWLPRYTWSGTLGAVLFGCASLTPSLLPRGWVLQGLIAGITAAIGYGVGVTVAWFVAELTESRLSAGLPPPRLAGARRGRARCSAVVMLWLGARLAAATSTSSWAWTPPRATRRSASSSWRCWCSRSSSPSAAASGGSAAGSSGCSAGSSRGASPGRSGSSWSRPW